MCCPNQRAWPDRRADLTCGTPGGFAPARRFLFSSAKRSSRKSLGTKKRGTSCLGLSVVADGITATTQPTLLPPAERLRVFGDCFHESVPLSCVTDRAATAQFRLLPKKDVAVVLAASAAFCQPGNSHALDSFPSGEYSFLMPTAREGKVVRTRIAMRATARACYWRVEAR